MRQVNELIRGAVASLIAEELDIPQDVFITVTRVDTSRDLRHADVYIMILPDGKRGSTMELLEHKGGVVQKKLGGKIAIKFTPKLRFRLDEGELRAQSVYDTLDTN